MRPCRPGEEQLYEFCRLILARLHNDWDIVIGICGEEGSGKSTLANLMGWYIDDKFTPRRNIIANPNLQEVSDRLLRGMPRYSVVIVDEAIKIMYKLGWQSKIQILMNTVFSVCRAQNKLVILCMPKFTDFNHYHRQHRIKVWVQIIKRGHAMVFVKDRSPFIKDCWHLDENNKVLNTYAKQKPLASFDDEDYIRALRRVGSYAFEFEFQEPPEDVKNEYLEIKKEMTVNLDTSGEERGLIAMYRDAFAKSVVILYTELGMTIEQIAQATGVSTFPVHKIITEKGLTHLDRAKVNPGETAERIGLNSPSE